MNRETTARFAIAFAACCELFGKTPSAELTKLYQLALADLSVEQIERGFTKAIRELKFFPRPAEIRELCGVMTARDRATIAWAAVDRATGTNGYYSSVDFGDTLTHAAIRALGGWTWLCDNTAEMEFRRRDFLSAYETLSRTGIPAGAGSYLPGWCEQQNGRPGRIVKINTSLPPADVRQLGRDVPRLAAAPRLQLQQAPTE